MSAKQPLPSTLPPTFLAKYDKLTPEQAGHLRHFHNLATQRDGNWGVMGSQEPGQEWLDAYRYQLATMAYAAGATHYHRMPALRSPMKTLIEDLIKKMLRREVWGYWFLTSHSGRFVDPDIQELRQPWADPIVKENIMYSGHLLMMVSLYAMLFNDDKYNEEGALTFHWDPIFWGMGPETFSYTRTSLQKNILEQMEREKWLGVCCEPNSIFIVCNQFPIIAMRYNDILEGTNIAAEVLEKYQAAWKEKGMTMENGLFFNWYSPKQDYRKPASDVGFTAWASAFMNSWNPTVARQVFETQKLGFLSRVEEDRVNVNSGPVAFTIRDMVKNEGADPDSLETTLKAHDFVLKNPFPPGPPFPRPLFGYIMLWVSEVGDRATLDGLLNHVERYLKPTWDNGGLYYPVNFQPHEGGNWTYVDPFTGNAAIGYSRLNIADGQKKMWEKPWTAEYVDAAPFIGGVDLSSGVDFLRGSWDEEQKAMVVTMRSWDREVKSVRLEGSNLPVGTYGVYVNGELTDTKEVTRKGDVVEVSVDVAGEDVDVVLLQG